MQRNMISLSVLESFAKASKVLSKEDLFDYIAYNDAAVQAVILCSNPAKRIHAMYLESCIDLEKDYTYDYIKKILSHAYQERYEGMDICNYYDSSNYYSPQRTKSISKAIEVLLTGYQSASMFDTWQENSQMNPKRNSVTTNLDLNAHGHLNIADPKVISAQTEGKKITKDYFELIDTPNTLFVLIKPSAIRNMDDTILDNREKIDYSSITLTDVPSGTIYDIDEKEPDKLSELIFIRVMAKISKNAKLKGWSNTPLGRFFCKVFIN